MRLLIDCTFVYNNPQYNTGIQRVVRNVISNISNFGHICEAIPIAIIEGRIHRVNSLIESQQKDKLEEILESEILKNHSWTRHLIKKYFRIFFPIKTKEERLSPLNITSDDVLVLLDSNWDVQILSQFSSIKKEKGIKIIGVVYDLIPITHEEYCGEGFRPIFQGYIDGMIKLSDGIMFISQTVKNEVINYAVDLIGKDQADIKWYDYFYLGSELDLLNRKDVVRNEIKEIYNKGRSVFLMVGTLDPRKNQKYLLDVFDILWKKGINVSICFIGRKGWKFDNLMNRINSHTELNKRLFYFSDATDSELEYCYLNSKALVFPSHVEGFGLPIVEAMQRGLPTMVSDIPIFREIGGDYLAYFNQNDPSTLVSMIENYLSTEKFPSNKPMKDWSWVTWNESTRIFIERIVYHVKQNS